MVVLSLALTGTFERLLIISNITGLVVYAMVSLAALSLQRRDVRVDGVPFRCPGGPLVHVVAAGGVCWMLWAITSRQDVWGVAILTAATVAAYLLRRMTIQRA